MGYSKSVQKRTPNNYVPSKQQQKQQPLPQFSSFVEQAASFTFSSNGSLLLSYLPLLLSLLLLSGSNILTSAAYQDVIDLPAPSLYFDQYNGFAADEQANPYLPTPPLDSVALQPPTGGGDQEVSFDYAASHSDTSTSPILPARVRFQRFTEALRESDLFSSPVFSQQQPPDSNNEQVPNLQNADFVETGSGQEWDSQFSSDLDSSSLLIEETATTNYLFASSSILPSPVDPFGGGISGSTQVRGGINRPPELRRRIPKLALTAGQAWRYIIPADTFVDEDGDLAKLISRVRIRHPNNLLMNGQVMAADSSVAGYFSWLQYDAGSRLLYAFPTELNAGHHEFELEVSDSSGAISREPFELVVRQHQSTRAFTHLLTLEGLGWSRESFASVVDALDELVKRLSSHLYSDPPFRNLVVHSYYLNNSIGSSASDTSSSSSAESNLSSGQPQPSFSLTWSNESLPVHPCNLSQLESLFRPLVAWSSTSEWSLERGQQLSLAPSAQLVQALQPDFQPQKVRLQLQGACDGAATPAGSALGNEPQVVAAANHSLLEEQVLQVRLKIGKLSFKLGEPFEYRIPAETFGNSGGAGGHLTRNLDLSLHTIDGLTLDKAAKYSFLEFDRDSQVLFGLPYSQSEHAGQLELLLTARDLKSGSKAREVFVISIEPVELSALNNRAFRMSLYLSARSNLFGPRERVQLGHRIASALQADRQLTVVAVERFARGAGLERVLRVADANREQAEDSYLLREVVASQDAGSAAQNHFFYKFTWTNESIGHRGDCPVEVIRQQVLDKLTQRMLELPSFEETSISSMAFNQVDELYSSRNDSMRFFARLRRFFEPEFELYHLRFEPVGACLHAFLIHDVGNRALADLADSAAELPIEQLPDSTPISLLASSPRPPSGSSDAPAEQADEYWLVVVVLVLVLALIFVVIMFFLGMHTYKMNQDKRFELQVRLAQARQNSMYLSSMVLANQVDVQDVCNQFGAPLKSMYAMNSDEKSSRRPVILDAEKQLLINGQQQQQQQQHLFAFKPTAVQLQGQGFQTMPVQANMSFGLDATGAVWSPAGNQQSMTLHRRLTPANQRTSITSGLNHSQSILTVASMNSGNQFTVLQSHQTNTPFYPQVPVISELPPGASNLNYLSLQRNLQAQQQRPLYVPVSGGGGEQKVMHHISGSNNGSSNSKLSNLSGNSNNNNNSNNNRTRNKSPSYSSSTSATNQSVITNANYVPQVAPRDFQ